jgi:hypothetical protein
VQVSGNTDLSRVFNLFLKAQKGTSMATAAQPPRRGECSKRVSLSRPSSMTDKGARVALAVGGFLKQIGVM